MKLKRVMGVFVMLVFLFTFVSATKTCNLDMTIINQDPYPAVPGENVDVVFQITGVQTTDCGKVSVILNEKFPFSIAPGNSNERSLQSPTFLRGYENFWVVPFTLKVNKNALNGNQKAEFILSSKDGQSQIIKEFNINVKDVTTNFEVFVRNYEKSDGILTLEIINIGENDIKSLVIEIPNQESVRIVGSERQTIGILDSNEDTTLRFITSKVKEGDIQVKIIYNDLINHRRELTKELAFNPSLFESVNNKKSLGISTYLLIILIILLVVNWFYKKHKTKKIKKYD
jgi:hypothetical protein